MKRALLLLTLLAGCQMAPPEPHDFSTFYERQPTTILVLPVINETTAADAPIAFSSTILHPLVERGYYIYPLPATLEILQANGIYEGGQLENVVPAKFHEILGADALLYVTLHAWDTNYAVIASSVEVALTLRLVDARSAETLWVNSVRSVVSSDSGSSGNPIADLLTAVISAAATAAATDYVPRARQ
ncbi:MAG TPA: GNA1162 family protein, partial [Planctomycetota bacterium]|nr:GNA1162 family protein [Planctomycetota bacterium]